MRELESNFYGRFRDRCKSIHCIRVENALNSGFPDVVMCARGHERMAEFKAEYGGGWVYMRNTQMSFSMQLLPYGVDVPILIGTMEHSFFIVKFSEMLKMPKQAYKGNYQRYNTKDFLTYDYELIPQRCDWDKTVVPILFPF